MDIYFQLQEINEETILKIIDNFPVNPVVAATVLH